MVRATNAVASHKRKKRIMKRAKGFWGDRKNHLRLTQGALMKAEAYSFIHRKQKKRNMRRMWITRLSAATKINGISYSKFICGLQKADCELDRKMLSEMAINDPVAFEQVVGEAVKALSA